MKPLEWLGLGVVAILGYFFWKNRTQQTTSPACPAQTQLDGWLSDIATGKMTTDNANALAQSYAGANPPCTDAVSAINAAIAAKGAFTSPGLAPVKGSTPAKTPSGVLYTPPKDLVPYTLTATDAAESVSDFRSGAGFATDDDFLAANAPIALSVSDGDWPPPLAIRYLWDNGMTTTAYPLGHAATFTPTGSIASGIDVPTYTSTQPGMEGEWAFIPWSAYSGASTDIGDGTIGPPPTRVTTSGGQRMSLNRGVWAWDAGMTVNVKPGSPVTKTATAGVGFAPAPLLLAAEPWR